MLIILIRGKYPDINVKETSFRADIIGCSGKLLVKSYAEILILRHRERNFLDLMMKDWIIKLNLP